MDNNQNMKMDSERLGDIIFSEDKGQSGKQECKTCGDEFHYADKLEKFLFMGQCPTCRKKLADIASLEEKNRELEKRKYDWKSICPPEYLYTDNSMLPIPKKIDEVLGWQYSKRGLLLFGKTRQGKSRCAWKLCERVFIDGKSVKVLDSLAGFQYATAFTNNSAEEWIMRYARCGLLFLDDAFKAKLTESLEAAVFAIVDYRLSHGLPIIATLNDTGETLASRMTSDRGGAFVARLKEMCDVIQF